VNDVTPVSALKVGESKSGHVLKGVLKSLITTITSWRSRGGCAPRTPSAARCAALAAAYSSAISTGDSTVARIA